MTNQPPTQTLSDRAVSHLRTAVPIARVIYVEPDVWVRPGRVDPPTDAIVIRGAD